MLGLRSNFALIHLRAATHSARESSSRSPMPPYISTSVQERGIDGLARTNLRFS
jgi:hypothetical protein